ncbi:zinc-dependent alcohol dehydrogenase family protein (plasmid) [Xanthobacter dioxanivorans]|uniref:Zinc-dependent alcohol dehydrogenase family protein n=2 Tax=Xanthobacteraceae TaxID=335928 RepID=A0A974SMM8_9HYPH|nr:MULTISPECIES: zinc-dependent alcohol dehydrogenase family protein [Xanthobacteraceae]MCV0404572.1 zinc-dependent alcohol dehydrogenase family protein [Chloroflexota bacterium]QRG09938.1 zinc-dependent alcohol dehydrogenase family protein [Xanthobacter dioxanivorans]UOK73457.1 zinc-dependent alcohol dehydrogenase family protein [Ancylobacter polymorphus]
MKGAVYDAKGGIEWKEVPKPKIEDPTDAIVRITKTTVCGTDLHILRGDVPSVTEGRVLGHEGVGVVEEVGSSVTRIKPGDRVVISAISSCGSCYQCKKGLGCHCEAKDGGWVLGNLLNGTQAHYTRVPHADNGLHVIPDGVDEEAAVMLSDILPTGFEVGVLAGNVQPGSNVVIVGAGPVGLAALVTAQFYSPASIIVIDTDDPRLEAAERLGATRTINPSKEDYAAVVKELTDGYGADTVIECVGIPETFDMCQKLVAKGGNIANIGVHGTAVDLHLQDLWNANIVISTGYVTTNSTQMLMKTVASGKIRPEEFVTHHFALDDIEEAYRVFGAAAKNKALKLILSA